MHMPIIAKALHLVMLLIMAIKAQASLSKTGFDGIFY